MKHSILLLAFALVPAAIASPNPARRIKAAEPSAIPVPLRQAVTFDQGHTHASLAQAEPQSDPAVPTPSGGPVINQPTSPTGRESLFGLGDINPQFYFVPRTNSKITWGVSLTFIPPTATDEVLGQGRWSAGPAAAVVVSTKRMVFGAVGNNVWSFTGSSERTNVNQMLFQPFLNYNLSHGWYLVSAPIITANWEAPDGDEQWTVPIGGGFGRVFAVGEQKVNATLQAYWNAVKPDGAGDWSLRAQLHFLLPPIGEEPPTARRSPCWG